MKPTEKILIEEAMSRKEMIELGRPILAALGEMQSDHEHNVFQAIMAALFTMGCAVRTADVCLDGSAPLKMGLRPFWDGYAAVDSGELTLIKKKIHK